MATASLAELRAALAEGRERLLAAIAGVSEQQFKKRPEPAPEDPTPWCIAEVLAHLLHDETIWNGRIELALQQDGATVSPTDPAAADAAVQAGRQAPVPQLIHGLLASRRVLEARLTAAERDGLMERQVRHPVRGSLSVVWMVNKVAEHEAEHVAQIGAVKQRLAIEAPA